MSAAGQGDGGPAALSALTTSADLLGSLFSVWNGIPFEVAFSLDKDERRAWIVAPGELDGKQWD